MDDRALARAALSGDAAATRDLVGRVMPIVQARVARVLVRRRGGSGRDVRQEVEDLVQEVFASLFENEGRVLRAWDPARGLSLGSFCGLIAEREAASILRSGRRSPWTETATEMDAIERDLPTVQPAEAAVASREELGVLVAKLREGLSPLGLEMFQRLVVDEEPVESVCKTTGMTADAVYAWKSRIVKLLRKIMSEEAARTRTPREETT